jgi:outer membrane protein assembly complex protein YaeT
MKLRVATWLAFLAAACASDRGRVGAVLQRTEQAGVQVVFAGALAYDVDRLSAVVRDDLARLADAPNRRAVIDDAAFALRRFYRSQGFADAEVDFDERATRVRFVVREGPCVEIERLEFPGAREWAAAELAALYDAPRSGGRPVLVENALADLVRAIESRYAAKGFARVEVADAAVAREPGAATARVSIVVREDQVFRIGRVRWTGDLAGADGELAAIARDASGQALTNRTVGALCTRATDFYEDHGHPDVRVRPNSQTLADDGTAQLELAVEPGPHVVVGAIDVRGLDRVGRDLVLSRSTFRVGREWRASDEHDSLRELFRTGLFTDVEFALEGEGETRTLVIKLREASTREFYVEPGYGSYERFRLGLGWRDRNWLDSGRALNVEGSLAELAQRASASLVDQHVLDSDVEGAITVFGGRRIEPSFTATDFGSSLTFTRQFARHVRGIAGYQLRRSGVSDVDAAVSTSELVQDVNIGSLTITPSYDDRDQYFVPTSGTFAQLSIEYASGATGSELDFVRTRWTASRFFPLGARDVLGASWRGGVIAPLPGTETIPLQERFFNGGENTVRAFHENDLGPRDVDGEPLGGEAFNVFSVELRHELATNLDGALFWDAGDVAPRAGDFLSLRDVRQGPGVGLRYRLPVGPVRLDLGYNPEPRGNESSWVLHLSVGMSF